MSVRRRVRCFLYWWHVEFSLSRIVLICLAWGLCPRFGYAMFERNWATVRAEGMGGAFVAIADDAGAALLNPAGLYQVDVREFTGGYKWLYGGVGTDLHSANAIFSLPVARIGTTSLALVETGFEQHSERTVRLSHGISLAEGLAFGYGLSGYNLYQKNIGSGYGFGLDLGMLARVYRIWTLGFSARNVNLPRIGRGEEGELPRMLVFGVGYSPSPGIRSALDLEKEPGKGTRLRVGQELRIIQDHLTIRVGVITLPVSFTFGFRAGVRFASLDYALATHSELGLTHSFGAVLQF